MFGGDPVKCEVCGQEMSCGKCFDGPCNECLKMDVCQPCGEVVQAAREQRAYLKEYHASLSNKPIQSKKNRY